MRQSNRLKSAWRLEGREAGMLGGWKARMLGGWKAMI